MTDFDRQALVFLLRNELARELEFFKADLVAESILDELAPHIISMIEQAEERGRKSAVLER